MRKSKPILISMPDQYKQRLDKLADSYGASRSETIRRLIDMYEYLVHISSGERDGAG